MVTLQEAKEQVRLAREKLKEQREEAELSKSKLQKQKESLPEIRSARALRQNQFSGLQGRIKRRQVSVAEENISSNVGKVEEYKKQLTKYETEQILPTEQKIAEIERYNLAREQLEKAISRGQVYNIVLYGEKNSLLRGMAKEYVKKENMMKEYNRKVGALTEKINTQGLESLNIKEQDFLKNLEKRGIVSLKEVVSTMKDSSRTDKIKAISPIVEIIREQVKYEDKTKGGKFLYKTDKFLEKAGVGVASTIYEGAKNIPSAVNLNKKFSNKFSSDINVKSISNVPFYQSTIGQTITDLPKNIVEVPFYQSTIGQTITDLPKNIVEAPIAIPKFGRTDTGKLTVQPSTIGRQAEVLFKEYPEMLGEESSKGYRQAFSNLGIPEIKIKVDRGTGKTKIVTTGAGYITEGVKYAPATVGYLAPGWQLAVAYDIQKLGSRASAKNIKSEAREIALQNYKQYGEGLTQQEYLSQVTPDIERQLKSGVRKEALITGGILLVGGGLVRGVSRVSRYVREPLIRQTETGFIVSSRGQRVLGSRIRLSKPEKGIGIKTEYLPSKRGTVVDFLKIKQPKANVKASATIGLDTGKKILYPEQVLEQSSITGRRTMVRKVTGLKDRTIYEGIPTDKVGRKKALNLLGDAFGEQGAKNILRYTPPKVKRVKLKEGRLDIKDKRATGEFTFLEERPVIEIDKSLGIKTRGGRTVKTTEYVDRLSIGQKNKLGVALEKSSSITTFPKKGTVNVKGFEFKKGVSIGKGSEIKELTKDVLFERVGGINIKRYVPKTKDLLIDTGRTILLKPVKTTDVTSFQSGGKQSSQQYFDNLYLKQAPQVKVTPLPKPKTPKVKLETQESSNGINLITRETKFAGTGLYERTEDVSVVSISPQTRTIQPQAVMFDPRQRSAQTSRVLQSPLSRVGTGIKTNLFQPTRELTRQLTKSLSDIKLETIQRTQPKQKIGFKQIFETIQKTRQTTTPKTPLKTPPKTPPKTPLKTPPKTPFLQRLLSKVETKEGKEDLFSVFVKKSGKEVVIGKTSTKGEAESLLKTKLVKTLRASGGIKFGETKLKAESINLGLDFGKSKRDKFLIVEKKEKRLRKSGTGFDIQAFRPTGSKRKSKLNLFGV